MEYVYSIRKSNRIYRSISVTAVVLHNFEDANTGALPWLGTGMLAAKLRDAQDSTDFVFHCFGEGEQVVQASPDPEQWLLTACPFCSTHELSQIWDIPSICFPDHSNLMPEKRGHVATTILPYRFTEATGVVRTPTGGPVIPSPLSITDCSGSIQKAQMAAPMNSRPAETPNGATHEPLDTR